VYSASDWCDYWNNWYNAVCQQKKGGFHTDFRVLCEISGKNPIIVVLNLHNHCHTVCIVEQRGAYSENDLLHALSDLKHPQKQKISMISVGYPPGINGHGQNT
jgi:hypothetical protein